MSTDEAQLVNLPASLKAHLEDDCFWIQRRGKLVSLPSEKNVQQILQDCYYHYLSLAHSNESVSASLLREVLDGIKIYFDFVLPDHLLYVPERAQYKSLGTGVVPSCVYGVEHLLRLFVCLPFFLSRAEFPPSLIQLLVQQFKDILQYISDHQQELFSEEHYFDSSPSLDSLPPNDKQNTS